MAKADELLAQLSELKTTYMTYHGNVKEQRKYYALDFADKVVPSESKDRIPAFIPPTARRATDEAVDHILYTPRIGVPKRPTESDQTKEQDIAEKKRAFINAWWEEVALLYNPLGDGRKPLMDEGMIAIRHSLDWSVIPKRADYKSKAKYNAVLDRLGKDRFLWIEELLDPESVFPDPHNHRDPRYCFVEYDILLDEAKRIFPKSTAEWAKGSLYSEVKYTEYWSYNHTTGKGDFYQWVNNEVQGEGEGKNPYPYVPIAIDDSGYGRVTKLSKPHERFVGLSQFTHDVFVAEARQLTSLEAVAEYTAFPVALTRNMDSSKVIQLGPGNTINLEGGKDEPGAQQLELLRWPEVPITVLQLLDKTNTLANSTLKMDVLGGIPLRGVETATEANAQIENASAKLGGPIAAMERVARKLSSWVFIDIEKVLEAPVSLYGTASDAPSEVRLKPTDIGGYYRVRVELQTTDAEAVAMNRARFWADMVNAIPFLSYETAMEKGNISDTPQMEMVRRGAENSLLSPEMTQLRTLSAAQALRQFTQMVEAEAIKLAGGPEGGGPGPAASNAAAPAAAPVLPDQNAAAVELRDVTQQSAQNRVASGV